MKKPRGKPVRMTKDELVVDEDAEDIFSKFAKGCEGVITINTPFGKSRFQKNKTNPKIKKVKTAPGRA